MLIGGYQPAVISGFQFWHLVGNLNVVRHDFKWASSMDGHIFKVAHWSLHYFVRCYYHRPTSLKTVTCTPPQSSLHTTLPTPTQPTSTCTPSHTRDVSCLLYYLSYGILRWARAFLPCPTLHFLPQVCYYWSGNLALPTPNFVYPVHFRNIFIV